MCITSNRFLLRTVPRNLYLWPPVCTREDRAWEVLQDRQRQAFGIQTNESDLRKDPRFIEVCMDFYGKHEIVLEKRRVNDGLAVLPAGYLSEEEQRGIEPTAVRGFFGKAVWCPRRRLVILS